LILAGIKTVEARRYDLGHHRIAEAGETLFLIETPGTRHAGGAVLGDVPVGPAPQQAQVVGTVSFMASHAYANLAAWQQDRDRHRIKEGNARYDWDGDGKMYAWLVGQVQRFAEPVPAGSKSQTGYPTPRALDIRLPVGTSASSG